jgi:hypothetical protein
MLRTNDVECGISYFLQVNLESMHGEPYGPRRMIIPLAKSEVTTNTAQSSDRRRNVCIKRTLGAIVIGCRVFKVEMLGETRKTGVDSKHGTSTRLCIKHGLPPEGTMTLAVLAHTITYS